MTRRPPDEAPASTSQRAGKRARTAGGDAPAPGPSSAAPAPPAPPASRAPERDALLDCLATYREVASAEFDAEEDGAEEAFRAACGRALAAPEPEGPRGACAAEAARWYPGALALEAWGRSRDAPLPAADLDPARVRLGAYVLLRGDGTAVLYVNVRGAEWMRLEASADANASVRAADAPPDAAELAAAADAARLGCFVRDGYEASTLTELAALHFEDAAAAAEVEFRAHADPSAEVRAYASNLVYDRLRNMRGAVPCWRSPGVLEPTPSRAREKAILEMLESPAAWGYVTVETIDRLLGWLLEDPRCRIGRLRQMDQVYDFAILRAAVLAGDEAKIVLARGVLFGNAPLFIDRATCATVVEFDFIGNAASVPKRQYAIDLLREHDVFKLLGVRASVAGPSEIRDACKGAIAELRDAIRHACENPLWEPHVGACDRDQLRKLLGRFETYVASILDEGVCDAFKACIEVIPNFRLGDAACLNGVVRFLPLCSFLLVHELLRQRIVRPHGFIAVALRDNAVGPSALRYDPAHNTYAAIADTGSALVRMILDDEHTHPTVRALIGQRIRSSVADTNTLAKLVCDSKDWPESSPAYRYYTFKNGAYDFRANVWYLDRVAADHAAGGSDVRPRSDLDGDRIDALNYLDEEVAEIGHWDVADPAARSLDLNGFSWCGQATLLDQIFDAQDAVQPWQKFFFMALIGRAVCLGLEDYLKTAGVIIGESNTGKSRIADVPGLILPAHAVANIESDDNPQFATQSLVGANVVIMREAGGIKDAFPRNTLLKILDQEPFSAHRKGLPDIEIRGAQLAKTMLFFSNTDLNLKEYRGEFRTRLFTVRFQRGIPPERQDTTLAEKMARQRTLLLNQCASAYHTLRQVLGNRPPWGAFPSSYDPRSAEVIETEVVSAAFGAFLERSDAVAQRRHCREIVVQSGRNGALRLRDGYETLERSDRRHEFPRCRLADLSAAIAAYPEAGERVAAYAMSLSARLFYERHGLFRKSCMVYNPETKKKTSEPILFGIRLAERPAAAADAPPAPAA